MKRKFEKSVDSPNSKKGLISDQSESEETPAKKVKTDSEVGSILRKGIKFSGPEEYLKFMQPVTISKKERRKINKQEKKQRDKIEKLNQNSAESEKTDEKTPKQEKKKLEKTEKLNGNSSESEKTSKKEKKKKKNLDKVAEPNSKVVFMKNTSEEFPKNSGNGEILFCLICDCFKLKINIYTRVIYQGALKTVRLRVSRLLLTTSFSSNFSFVSSFTNN